MEALNSPLAFSEVLGRRKSISQEALSPHFTLHYLASAGAPTPAQPCLRLGFIIPKRLSKHACRRNLVRRTWKEALTHTGPGALAGAYDVVVRQKKPFDAAQFRSAKSKTLGVQIRAEAQALIALWLKQIT